MVPRTDSGSRSGCGGRQLRPVDDEFGEGKCLRPLRAVQLGSTEPTHRQLLEPREAWMKNSRRRNLTQAAACLICAIPAWRYSFVLEGTEFRGSRATGWLVSSEDAGAYLLVL